MAQFKLIKIFHIAAICLEFEMYLFHLRNKSFHVYNRLLLNKKWKISNNPLGIIGAHLILTIVETFYIDHSNAARHL